MTAKRSDNDEGIKLMIRLAVFTAAARIYAAQIGTPADAEIMPAVEIAWDIWRETKRQESEGAESSAGKIHGKFKRPTTADKFPD